MNQSLSLQNGYTALHWGVNKNNKECVAVLLEKGANPLIKDKVCTFYVVVKLRLHVASTSHVFCPHRHKQQLHTVSHTERLCSTHLLCDSC